VFLSIEEGYCLQSRGSVDIMRTYEKKVFR
jgi:hypothetical protein